MSPIVTVADKGLTESVIAAIEEALDKHELTKVKIRHDREKRDVICKEICAKTGALEVQRIGMVLLVYRPAKKSKIDLSASIIKS